MFAKVCLLSIEMSQKPRVQKSGRTVASKYWLCCVVLEENILDGARKVVPYATDMFLNHTPGDVVRLSTEESNL